MKNQKITEQFSDGIRMLMLCQRNKEGRKTNKTDRSSKRKISTNKEEFFKILEEFQEIKKNSKESLRIYSCVNKRNINKAIRNFKIEQLEVDYYDIESRNKFYFDIKNRWISSLMKQNCRDETFFLIDIDKKEDNFITNKRLEKLKIEIIVSYQTKNGWHIITKPFNPNLLPDLDIKKDALLLLDY